MTEDTKDVTTEMTAVEKAVNSVVAAASVATKRQCEVDRKRQEAIAATFDAWFKTLDAGARQKVLAGLQDAATPVNRKRIAAGQLELVA